MIKLVLTLILSILLSVSWEIHAAEHVLDWLPQGANMRQRINLDNLNFEQEIGNDQWQLIKRIQIDANEHQVLLKKYSNADFFYLSNHIIRFALQGTGMLYDFDLRQATLKRVDQTVHSGYNFSAIRFYRNKQLYSIGGEGFWNYNKHITYFDEQSSKEWELFRPKNQGPKHMGDGFQGYSEKRDLFYSGGSNNKNYLEDEFVEFTKEFYQFDFRTKSWSLLGKISDKIPLAKHRVIYWNGEHFIQLAGDRLYIIDPAKNEVYLYKDNGKYFEPGGKHYVSQDTIKYYHFAHRGPISIIPVLDLLKKSSYIGPFYVQDYTTYYLIGLLLLGLGGITFLIYQRKRKLKPNFDPLERKLLKALLASGENYIPTNDLNEILDCGTKSPENQRRIRFMTIKQVNEKLAFYCNIKNAIERSASTEDKRLVTYRLKRGIQEKIKTIL